MGTAATNRRLRVILTEIRDGKLIPNPAFQRRLVWSTKHKVNFLRTVLEGLPFPEVFIAAGDVNPDTGEGQELIVDGQQRLTTLFQYFTGAASLKLGNALLPYARLESGKKLAFLEYEVVVRDLGSLTEDQTRDLFYRINSTSYGLNAMEVNNARFDGALKQFCDELSENSFFENHQTFNSFDAKRMNDVRWCLTLVITLLSTYFNRDSEHEEYLERYNDEFPQQGGITARIAAAFSFIEDLDFGATSRIWQKSDLFTLLIELDRARDLVESLGSQEVASRLDTFYKKVDRAASGDVWSGLNEEYAGAAEYYAATRSGSNDRSSRVRRGEILGSAIRNVDGSEPKTDEGMR